jgi:2-keto-3-deoxy-L-rhamnonate aldolase RhmA
VFTGPTDLAWSLGVPASLPSGGLEAPMDVTLKVARQPSNNL